MFKNMSVEKYCMMRTFEVLTKALIPVVVVTFESVTLQNLKKKTGNES